MLSHYFLKEESIENMQFLYKYDWRRHKSRIFIEKNKRNK